MAHRLHRLYPERISADEIEEKRSSVAQKVLVTEKVAQECIDILQQSGLEVDICLETPPEKLRELIASYDALIVRSATKVTREVIEAGTNLKVIGRAGVGVDNIDIAAATECGVIVCNAPVSNIVSAAEHTVAMMLATARNIPQAHAFMKEGKWERHRFAGIELFEKTLAIVGLGRIGALVAERARGFGMKLIGYDPYCSVERAASLGVRLVDSLDEVLTDADFITVHLPKTNETLGMFGPNEMAQMKDGVVVINCARGGIFQEKALADFVAAGKIRAVAIDMFEEEPCFSSPLHDCERAVLTPHIAAVTEEAQARAGRQIAEYVITGLAGSIVPTAINMAPVSSEVMDALGPYVPACQIMGKMIAQMTGEIPSNLKITAAGNLANCDASILVAGALDGLLSYRAKTTQVSPINAEAVAKRHGIHIALDSQVDAYEYASTVTLDADGISVACTLAGAAQTPRIVSLRDYHLDIEPSPHVLIFEYVDAPGKIGAIGSLLGQAGINITTMQIGLKNDDVHAIAYVNTSEPASEDLIDKLSSSLELINLWQISL